MSAHQASLADFVTRRLLLSFQIVPFWLSRSTLLTPRPKHRIDRTDAPRRSQSTPVDLDTYLELPSHRKSSREDDEARLLQTPLYSCLTSRQQTACLVP